MLQVVVSDGLSTDAITANYEEIPANALHGLKQAGRGRDAVRAMAASRLKIDRLDSAQGGDPRLLASARELPVGEYLLRGVLPRSGVPSRRPNLYPISTQGGTRR